MPIQSNYDFGIGPGDGTKSTTNIQPVIPIDLNENWNIISRTIQPFLSYTTPQATTFTLNMENTYDWGSNEWNLPVNFVVSQLVKIGGQPVQFFGGVRYYAETPDGGPEWG